MYFSARVWVCGNYEHRTGTPDIFQWCFRLSPLYTLDYWGIIKCRIFGQNYGFVFHF